MWKWLVMAVAGIGAFAAVALALRTTAPKPVPPLAKEPVRNPFPHCIAGAGLVEPASENVVIGVSEPGRVAQVFVTEGQTVKKGAPLFQIDARNMEADLVTAQAAVAAAEAEWKRVQAFRRKEDEPGLRAKLAEAQAAVAEAEHAVAETKAAAAEQQWTIKDLEDQVTRLQATAKAGASPEEQVIRAQYAVQTARAKLATLQEKTYSAEAHIETAKARVQAAQADLNTFLAGPWSADVERARAGVEQAQALVTRMKMEIERRTVRAPMDATVIRRKMREGEYAMANNTQAESAAIVLGSLGDFNVRVDIDEFDAQRFDPKMKAVAFLKGDNKHSIPLTFEHLEPFIVPKRALTNSQHELVDTRVLQVIFKLGSTAPKLYVGQQLEVFIDTGERTDETADGSAERGGKTGIE